MPNFEGSPWLLSKVKSGLMRRPTLNTPPVRAATCWIRATSSRLSAIKVAFVEAPSISFAVFPGGRIVYLISGQSRFTCQKNLAQAGGICAKSLTENTVQHMGIGVTFDGIQERNIRKTPLQFRKSFQNSFLIIQVETVVAFCTFFYKGAIVHVPQLQIPICRLSHNSKYMFRVFVSFAILNRFVLHDANQDHIAYSSGNN